ncbi:unnamed protein product, partial [Discosporangium mesarthrocarpum]
LNRKVTFNLNCQEIEPFEFQLSAEGTGANEGIGGGPPDGAVGIPAKELTYSGNRQGSQGWKNELQGVQNGEVSSPVVIHQKDDLHPMAMASKEPQAGIMRNGGIKDRDLNNHVYPDNMNEMDARGTNMLGSALQAEEQQAAHPEVLLPSTCE